jgi:hypothetical protein
MYLNWLLVAFWITQCKTKLFLSQLCSGKLKIRRNLSNNRSTTDQSKYWQAQYWLKYPVLFYYKLLTKLNFLRIASLISFEEDGNGSIVFLNLSFKEESVDFWHIWVVTNGGRMNVLISFLAHYFWYASHAPLALR